MMIGLLAALSIRVSETFEAHLLSLAHESVVAAVLGKPPPGVQATQPATPVFVTIEVQGVIRGCRGGLATRTRCLEEEVSLSAREAAVHDPRYRPLSTKELMNFLVTVTLVERTAPIEKVDGLRPENGLVLKCGAKTGIVLPWEGKDPALRLKWAYRKAGVAEGSAVKLERLIARRFRG